MSRKTVQHRGERLGALLKSGETSQRPGGRAEVFQPVQIEQHRMNPDALELLRRRDVGPGIIEDHEVGLPRRNRLDVRRHSVPDAGDCERRGRVVAPLRAADDAISRADREQDFSE